MLGKSTAYIERSHLTSQLFNTRQTRWTLAFSKDIDMYQAAVVWEDGYYNLVKPRKSLRVPISGEAGQKWRQRTPTMSARLTDHIWTAKELLTTISLPRTDNT